MPELSQNFEFTINSASTVQVDHPAASTVVTYTSESRKGDGYYKGGDAFHTVEIKLDDFIGNIKFQGSLAQEPADSDWFDVTLEGQASADLEYTNGTSEAKLYNMIGNFVYVRVVVSNFTQGTISYIRMNY